VKGDSLPLLSRVADSVYWIARYIERAENVARFIGVNLNLQLDLPLAPAQQWQPLIDTTGDAAVFKERFGSATQAKVIEYLAYDLENSNSIASCLRYARENARSVRETISSEMWAQVNGMYLQIQTQRSLPEPERMLDVFREIRMGCHLFQGITDATMGHGEGWQYLRVGRFLERADATAALLDLYYRNPEHTNAAVINHGEWAGLLRSCASLEAYCRVYTAELRPDRIAEFLLLNPVGPRSIRFAAAEVESSLQTIGEHVSRRSAERAERLAGRLHASLDYGQVDEILSEDSHAYLAGISRQCALVHTALQQTYMTYSIESALPA